MGIFERVAFGSQYVTSFVRYRVVGWFYQAMVVAPHGTSASDPLAELTPGRFLATPGLWLGLLFAAACLFGAVRLRRYRGPV
jgi:hypothetical protein